MNLTSAIKVDSHALAKPVVVMRDNEGYPIIVFVIVIWVPTLLRLLQLARTLLVRHI
jgi:hypothetical protein